jgi:hypothetical protein
MIIPTWIKPAALGVALLMAAYGGYHYRDVVAERDTLKFQTQAQEAAKTYTAQLVSIGNQLEAQNYANEKKHNDELAYYRNLVKQSGGLFDNGTSNFNPTGTPGSNNATPNGQGLSPELSEYLIQKASNADAVVDQYLLCQDYVKRIQGVGK